MAPTSLSDADALTAKGCDGSGYLRIGAVVKAVFSLLRAILAAGA